MRITQRNLTIWSIVARPALLGLAFLALSWSSLVVRAFTTESWTFVAALSLELPFWSFAYLPTQVVELVAIAITGNRTDLSMSSPTLTYVAGDALPALVPIHVLQLIMSSLFYGFLSWYLQHRFTARRCSRGTLLSAFCIGITLTWLHFLATYSPFFENELIGRVLRVPSAILLYPQATIFQSLGWMLPGVAFTTSDLPHWWFVARSSQLTLISATLAWTLIMLCKYGAGRLNRILREPLRTQRPDAERVRSDTSGV